MLKIGITGGIGSGKSIVCKVFKQLGIPVYPADMRARMLTETDAEVRQKIITLLGSEAYIDNTYNRKLVSKIVFSDEEKLKQLNAIVHPAVERDFQDWLKENASAGYIVKEAAILFESGAYKEMDIIIYVDASEQLRIKRVMNRDKTSRENVLARIRNQSPADKIKPLADRVIENNDKQLILPQILEIHNTLMERNKSHG